MAVKPAENQSGKASWHQKTLQGNFVSKYSLHLKISCHHLVINHFSDPLKQTQNTMSEPYDNRNGNDGVTVIPKPLHAKLAAPESIFSCKIKT